MEYKNQCNRYTLETDADGRYRVEIDGAKENASFSSNSKRPERDGAV